MITQRTYAIIAVLALDAVLLAWGIQWLMIPPIYRFTQPHNPFLLYQGHILIALAIALAWFHRWAAEKLLWLSKKVHRWISALLMMGVIGIEGFMHVLSIPHLEGWWIPIFGGSAFLTGISAWFHNLRAKSKH